MSAYTPEPKSVVDTTPKPATVAGRGGGYDSGAVGELYDEDSAIVLTDEDGTTLGHP